MAASSSAEQVSADPLNLIGVFIVRGEQDMAGASKDAQRWLPWLLPESAGRRDEASAVLPAKGESGKGGEKYTLLLGLGRQAEFTTH